MNILAGEAATKYWLSPVQTDIGEGGFADFKVCNENGEQLATFGFADEHEARIARALMIRAFSKAVLVVPHTRVARRKDDADEQSHGPHRLLLEFMRSPVGSPKWLGPGMYPRPQPTRKIVARPASGVQGRAHSC